MSTARAKMKRHFICVAGTIIMPSMRTVSAALTRALFLSQAAFSLSFTQVSTASAISAIAKIAKKMNPMKINLSFRDG